MLKYLWLCLLLVYPAWAQEVCDRQASQILAMMHLAEPNHQVYKENLATMLFNLREPLPESSIQSLESLRSWLREREQHYREQRTVGSNESGRWPNKIESALVHPYTDSQAARHLDEVISAFRQRCLKLNQTRPGYARRYYATGGLVFGRFGAFSELDYFFNDPLSGTKPLVVTGLCRGVAYDELTFQQRVEHPLVAGASLELSGPEPWEKVRELVYGRFQERGLKIEKIALGWKVQRAGYPARHYEDPTPEAERLKPL
ncbi:hypothetical protein JST97_16345 [bacterium]|nr:hypothetical protein [bacterium]